MIPDQKEYYLEPLVDRVRRLERDRKWIWAILLLSGVIGLAGEIARFF